MRIVFMGTPAFALPSLSALAREHEVVAVYTRPDAVSGRGKTLRPTPVKVLAQELGIPVEQPRTLRDGEVQARLVAYRPDAIVVAAYGLILPPEVLDVAPLGCINVHGSLLPRWRGAAPIQRAILSGDTVAGVAIMRMEEGLDTGPYCETAEIPIDDLTADQLAERIAQMGAEALLRALSRLARSECAWVDQDESAVTYADKIAKSEVVLSPDITQLAALRRVRASGDTAPARMALGDRTLRVLNARASAQPVAAGRYKFSNSQLIVGLADGAVELLDIKPEGKSEMCAGDWARGARLTEGTWGAPQ